MDGAGAAVRAYRQTWPSCLACALISPCLTCCPLTLPCASLQTNVGNLISKLEKEFNVQLLIRTKGMPPQATPAGALLLRYADRLLTLGSDAVAAAKDLQDTTMGHHDRRLPARQRGCILCPRS